MRISTGNKRRANQDGGRRYRPRIVSKWANLQRKRPAYRRARFSYIQFEPPGGTAIAATKRPLSIKLSPETKARLEATGRELSEQLSAAPSFRELAIARAIFGPTLFGQATATTPRGSDTVNSKSRLWIYDINTNFCFAPTLPSDRKDKQKDGSDS